MKVVIALSLLLVLCSAHVSDPIDALKNATRGFFAEFQHDIADKGGCYYVVGGIINDVGTVIREIKDFTENDLPRIVAALTDIVYRCIDLDTPCKFSKVVNATVEIINHHELIKERITLFVLLTFLNNLQKGVITLDWEAIGKAPGFFLRNLLAIQI